jgi:hypothetical protein
LASLPVGVRQMAEWLKAGYEAVGAHITIPTGERAFLPIEIMYPIYLIPGLLALIIASLVTRQHNAHQVAMFYARIDTPLGKEHELVEKGFIDDDLIELDKETVHVDARDMRDWGRLLVPDLLRLRKLLRSGEAKWSDYRVDLIGFAGAVVFVGLFLAGVQWLGSLF